MEFIVALVGHLAWPVMILILVLIFRRPIVLLIADVSEGEAGPGGLKFKRDWRRTADAATSATVGTSTSVDGSEDHGAVSQVADSPAVQAVDRGQYEAYHAAIMPEGAIEGAHQKLADRLYEILGKDRATIPWRRADDIKGLAREACDRGLIVPRVVDSVDGIGVLYDLARSAPDRVTVSQAREFQALVNAALYALRNPVA